jgi:hypothetical protein
MMSISKEEEILRAGAEIVSGVLEEPGFAFKFESAGRGSGGHFAWGQFVRGDRRIEMHYRKSLGMVSFHIGSDVASHDAYFRELGVQDRCQYPGFSSEPLSSFSAFAHDLQFAADFLTGDGEILRRASKRQHLESSVESERLNARYAGDTERIAKMRSLFKQKRYADVVSTYGDLRYPHLLTDAERKLVQVAQSRSLA